MLAFQRRCLLAVRTSFDLLHKYVQYISQVPQIPLLGSLLPQLSDIESIDLLENSNSPNYGQNLTGSLPVFLLAPEHSV